jgi:hypothetical protein
LRQITQTAKTEAIHSDDDPKGKKVRTFHVTRHDTTRHTPLNHVHGCAQNLNDAISELEALLMKLRPLANAALANPKDKKALKALTDDLDKIAAATDKSASLCRRSVAVAFRTHRTLSSDIYVVSCVPCVVISHGDVKGRAVGRGPEAGEGGREAGPRR